MTLANTHNTKVHVGNGTAESFTFDFKIINDSDLEVVVTDTDDVDTTLTLDDTVSGYEVVYDDANGESGGYINLHAGALTDSYVITISRTVPLTQETDIKNQGYYYPHLHENAFDKLTMIAQQLNRDMELSIKVHASEDSSFDGTLPSPIGSYTDSCVVIASDGLGFDFGPSVADIEAAATAAADAPVYAAAAAVSATSAATSATSASTYATSASSASAYCLSVYNAIGFTMTAVKTSNYSATTAAEVILCDPSAGSFSVTLDDATATGVRKIVKNVTDSPYAVNIGSAFPIDESTTYLLAEAYGAVTLVMDNVADRWMVIA